MLWSLLHAKERGFSKCKFHQFLKNHKKAVMLASTRTENLAQSCQDSGLLRAALGGLLVGQCLEK